MRRKNLSPLVLSVGLAAATLFQAAQGQSQPSPEYKVPAVYLPPLRRPPVASSMGVLGKEATGSLPRYDGEPFHLTLPQRMATTKASDAKNQVLEVLQTIGIALSPGDLTQAVTSSSPGGRSGKALDQYQASYDSIFEDSMKRKLGRISAKTAGETKRTADQLREHIGGRATTVAFRQLYRGTLVDNAQLAYTIRPDGRATLVGNAFQKIEPDNSVSLSAERAISAASRYVQKYAKVLGPSAGDKPSVVILPYEDRFKYAWRIGLDVEDGPYRVWVDAKTGSVLQLLPQFFHVSARGLAFNPSPTVGTVEKTFEVDAAANGQYRLKLAGQLAVTNSGADGKTSTDLTLADDGSGEANFNVSPLNGTAVERTSTSGYNSRFQEINAFAWLYQARQFADLLGSQSQPMFTATVNTPGNNANSSGSFQIGNATTSSSTTCNPNAFNVDMFNSANDASVLLHEYGHNINALQYGVGGGSMTGSINEGLADFWACTQLNTDTFGAWWGHNCASPTQTGFAPRQCEGSDVFPEHRYLGSASLFQESHADGQIICWALWNVRREYFEASAVGVLATDVSLMRSMTTAGAGIINGLSDQRVHDSFVDLERQLVLDSGTDWFTHKIVSGFARAGLFLSDQEAIIDINDDYLNRGSSSPPTFTVWTGRDYTFDATGKAVTTGTLPFNTRVTIDVASNADFTNDVSSSGVLSGVTAGAGGTLTWQLPAATWNAIKARDRLYYRVKTTDGDGGLVRNCESTGDGSVTGISPAYAVINDSGECECACSTASGAEVARAFGRRVALAVLPFGFPLAYIAYRRRRGRVHES